MELTQRYLLDTNAIVYFLGGRLAEPLPAGHYSFSVITEIELLSFAELSANDEQKIGEFLSLLDRVELTQSIRLETIRLRRQKRLKLPDALIAASAINNKAILLSNDQAFQVVDGLMVQSVRLNAPT